MTKNNKTRLFFVSIFIIFVFFFFYQNKKTSASKTVAEQITDLQNLVENLQNELSTKQASFVFTKDLRFGDDGIDVLMLQKTLNSKPETIIANSGPGSPGHETTFFGLKTKIAVSKFQELNASSILYPSGLFMGTGFVGQKTREKLNEGVVSSPVSTNSTVLAPVPNGISQTNSIPSNSSMPGSLVFPKDSELFTGFISNYTSLPGKEITLSGGGFLPNQNTVNLVNSTEKYKISDLNSLNNNITFTIPFDISPGRYDVFVSNKKGKSIDQTLLIILSPNAKPPKISSVTPSSGMYGQEVTIHGENFSLKDNQVRSGYGIISDLESKDGTTIKFKVEPFPNTPLIEQGYGRDQGIEWPIDFYVVNSNGVSEQSGKFILKI